MEQVYKWLVTGLGAILTFVFGAWSIALNALLVLVIIDYTSGIFVAWMHGELKSKVGFVGIARKLFIFAMVAVAHMVDLVLIENGFEQGAMIMSFVTVAYIINEVISITENAGKGGVFVPSILGKGVAILQTKYNDTEQQVSTVSVPLPQAVTPGQTPPAVLSENKIEEKNN